MYESKKWLEEELDKITNPASAEPALQIYLNGGHVVEEGPLPPPQASKSSGSGERRPRNSHRRKFFGHVTVHPAGERAPLTKPAIYKQFPILNRLRKKK